MIECPLNFIRCRPVSIAPKKLWQKNTTLCISPCECKAFCWIYTSVFHAHIQCVEPHTQHTNSIAIQKKSWFFFLLSFFSNFLQNHPPSKWKNQNFLNKNNNTQFNSKTKLIHFIIFIRLVSLSFCHTQIIDRFGNMSAL